MGHLEWDNVPQKPLLSDENNKHDGLNGRQREFISFMNTFGVMIIHINSIQLPFHTHSNVSPVYHTTRGSDHYPQLQRIDTNKSKN